MPSDGNAVNARVFLSYARADDEAFVRRLYEDLTAAGFQVWFDRESLLSRGLTFHQEIRDAIRAEVDKVVYVGGPKAAASPYVREEWQSALEYDHVAVVPILRRGDYNDIPGELSLLHCEDFRDDAAYPAALAHLVNSLRQPNPPLGALLAVPSLPGSFIARPDLMRSVRDALLVDLKTTQVIASADARVGVQGMGGIGKSVLAAVVARNRQVRQAYPDGVVWISCGQELTDEALLNRQRDLAGLLGGNNRFASIAEGKGILRELLAAKAVLVVLDDVWRAPDTEPFNVLGHRCRMLITTRDAGVLHGVGGQLVPVSLLTEPEALDLLAGAVGLERSALPADARAIVKECEGLPLALALCGGMARSGQTWTEILEALRESDLEWVGTAHPINPQHASIWKAMKVSYDALAVAEGLPPDAQRRFAELVVFSTEDSTDGKAPEVAAYTLWGHTGHLAGRHAAKLLIALAERSLVQLDTDAAAPGQPCRRRFRLHDLLHDFAARIAGDPVGLHRTLLDAYAAQCPAGWPSGTDDGYFLQNLVGHLLAAGRLDDAVALLSDLPWVEAKCRAALVFDLQDDYQAVLTALPEAQAAIEEERFRRERLTGYTADLISFARAWSDRRDRQARGEPVSDPSAQLPAPVPSCRMWTDQEIQAERRRILQTTTRLDRLKAFSAFVSAQCYPLLEHGRRAGFVPQHAFNSDSGGPVHVAAIPRLTVLNEPHLLRRWPPTAVPNPRPALLRTLEGHTREVIVVSVMPDGRRAVSGSNDKTLRVWDLESGACLKTLEGHSDWVWSVSATPDGRRAVSNSRDNTLRVWDLESGACLRTLEGDSSYGRSVSVTPDGRRAVSGSGDHTLRVWDLESGACLQTLEGHIAVRSVSVTPDGRRAVLGSDDKTLRVWDLESGACLRTLEGHSSWVTSVSVTPDGRRAVSGSGDHTLRVWDLESGACLRMLEGHSDTVRSVSVTPDSRRAVSGSFDKTLRVWDLESWACLRTLEGHSSYIKSVSVTPDGRRAVSGSGDKTLRVWDLESGACLRTLETHSSWVQGVSTTPDGRRAVSGSEDKTLRLWDPESGACLRTLEGHSGEVTSMDMTPDGRRAVSGSDGNTLHVWDLESGACLRMLEGHSDTVRRVSVTPDGRRAVSGNFDKTVRVWDLESGACLRTLGRYSSYVKSVSVTPDGRRAVSGSRDNTRRVWDSNGWACLRTLEEHSSWVQGVRMTPDGRRAVSGSRDNTLRVWDLESGACLRTLKGHSSWVGSVSVTPDGRRAVSGSGDHTLRVWDLESGACLRTLEGHSGAVESVSVTPDGRRAVAGSYGTPTLRVWDLDSGVCLRTLEGHSEWVGSVSVTPDGRRAVSGSSDRTLRVWDLESGACLGVFCAAAPVTASAMSHGKAILGTAVGEVVFVDMRNMPGGPGIVTVTWFAGSLHRPSARCSLCGVELELATEVVSAIESLSRHLAPEQSPCLDLPAAAFDDPRLLSSCPACGGALRFNPFLVDAREGFAK